jgi:hypothetical protein
MGAAAGAKPSANRWRASGTSTSQLSTRSRATYATSNGPADPVPIRGSPAVAALSKFTDTPADQVPSSTAAVCQCGGSSTAARSPGRRPHPRCSRFAVRVTHSASSAAESAVRSPVASS